MTTIDRAHTALVTLGLPNMNEVLECQLERAVQEQRAYAEFLTDLLAVEVEARHERYLSNRLRMAHLPYHKTLADFDFAFQPSIDERTVRELQTLRFVHEASNVLLLGPPGVGKTHLAVGLAMEAIHAGFSALFVTAHELVEDLGRATREGCLHKRLGIYQRPQVLLIDELGYLPLDKVGATMVFQLISARYEHGSVLITSNKSYGDWGEFFPDSIIASAVLDRLLHHATTLNIRGESYRLKDRRKAGFPPPASFPPG